MGGVKGDDAADVMAAELLEKIRDVEAAAREDEPAAWAGDVLRLCRAHREIVELYSACKAAAEAAVAQMWSYRQGTSREYYTAEREADKADAALEASAKVVAALARAYGIEVS